LCFSLTLSALLEMQQRLLRLVLLKVVITMLGSYQARLQER